MWDYFEFLQMFYMLSFNMITPLVAQYVELLGGSTTVAGLIAGMFSFCALAYRPFVGYFSDRANKKKILFVGVLLGAFAIAGYGVSYAYWVVAFFRLLHALSLCILTTLSAVVAMDFIPKDRTAEGVGYIGVATMVGMSLGPGFGVFVSNAFSHETAFFVGAAITVIGAFVVLAIPYREQEQEKEPLNGFSLKGLLEVTALPLTFTMATISYCTGLTSSFLVVVGAERGLADIALFFFMSSGGMILFRPFAGKYTDRHGVKLLVFICLASEIICMSVLAFADSTAMILVAAFFRIFGQGTGQAVIQGQILKDAPEESRSRASATFYIGVDVGQGGGAIVGGALADAFGYTAAYLSAVPVLIAGTAMFVHWLLRFKKKVSISS